jgi:O-antigen/teichoic acid export membrane protein
MKYYGIPTVACASFSIFLGYLLLTLGIVPQKELIGGWPALAILLSTLTVLSAFIPFDNLMLVSGHPGYQAIQHLAVIVTNVLLCLLFVPFFGITGAALSTAGSYIVGIAMMLFLTQKFLGWNLVVNQTRGL